MGHWYVAGVAPGEKDRRVFRVDRMSNPEPTGDGDVFRRPRGFRVADAIPDAPWEAGSDEVVVTVRFDPDVAWWARRQLTSRATVSEHDDGAFDAVIPVFGVDAFIGWIIGFGGSAEIISPPEVRQRLVAHVGGAA
jgi:predicted DNA-binding transcriptional regulator YafY